MDDEYPTVKWPRFLPKIHPQLSFAGVNRTFVQQTQLIFALEFVNKCPFLQRKDRG